MNGYLFGDTKNMGKNEFAMYQSAQAFMDLEDGEMQMSKEEKQKWIENGFVIPMHEMFAETMLDNAEITEELL